MTTVERTACDPGLAAGTVLAGHTGDWVVRTATGGTSRVGLPDAVADTDLLTENLAEHPILGPAFRTAGLLAGPHPLAPRLGARELARAIDARLGGHAVAEVRISGLDGAHAPVDDHAFPLPPEAVTVLVEGRRAFVIPPDITLRDLIERRIAAAANPWLERHLLTGPRREGPPALAAAECEAVARTLAGPVRRSLDVRPGRYVVLVDLDTGAHERHPLLPMPA